MGVYQTGSNIGELLRMIQEDQSQNPIINPASFPGSPIRGGIQQPLLSQEAPDTSRVVSIKPEAGTTPQSDTMTEQNPIPTGTLLNNAPGSLPPAGGQPNNQPGNQPSVQPRPQSTPQPANRNIAVAQPKPNFFATQIRPSAPSVNRVAPQPSPAPKAAPSRVGQPFAFNPFQFIQNLPHLFGGQVTGALKNITSKSLAAVPQDFTGLNIRRNFLGALNRRG